MTNLRTDKEQFIYKIKCCDCQAIYISETGRNLNTRLTEHRRGTVTSTITLLNTIYKQTTESTGTAACVTYSTNYYQRIVLESWFTNLEQTPINLCLQLSALFKRLIDIHIKQGHLQEVTILLNLQDVTNKLNPFQEMV